EKRSAIRVVLDSFEFVDAGKSDSGSSMPTKNIQPDRQTESPASPKQTLPPSEPDLDEDVPF
ncbi:hypothetical protein OAP38_05145, partial [Opitutales bacterium]|nr:hypothetical protein [Opitutales bacterium]